MASRPGSNARARLLPRVASFCAGIVAGGAAGPTLTAELPVPCAAGTCGASGPTTWVTAGNAGATLVGNTLRIDQTSSSAILNWRTFNVSPDGTVKFVQPDASAIALNRIFDANPSRVLGALNANGRIYLLNQNGIVFGEGAKVNVGGLVASSLDITPQALQRGIADAVSVAGSAAFTRYRGAGGAVLPSGAVQVEPGAQIESSQGQVLLIAPEVVNRGTIRTPDGQTILAAGDQVYLATSTDPNLRGLFVEVRGDGTVTNGEAGNASRTPEAVVGRVTAERGNVTMAATLVRQLGQVSATTSTRANGTVRLLARSTTGSVTAVGLRGESVADRGGSLYLGTGSETSVSLDASDKSETVDVNVQPESRIQLSGESIELDAGSRVAATSGLIQAYATSTPSVAPQAGIRFTPDRGRLVVASGAVLDTSGANVALPVERNVIQVELRGNQLADSPLQREGPLRSQTVFVDVRDYGTRSDGSSWVGTPLADVSGDISNVRRGLAERSLAGGEIRLQSSGTVIVGADARLDVSGGYIEWLAGEVRTSRLLGADGRTYDISVADRDRAYLALLDNGEVVNQRWGVTEARGFVPPNANSRFEAGYLEGRDAGAVAIAAPQVLMDGDVVGRTTVGKYQRLDPATARAGAFDRLPVGAAFSLGLDRAGAAPDLVTPDVEFSTTLAVPGGLTLEQAAALSPQQLQRVLLSTDLFGADRATSVSVFSNGEVRVPGAAPVELPQGGALRVRAGRIVVDGDVRIPSGTIDLAAGETVVFRGDTEGTTNALTVGAGVTLDARGSWVNDDVRFNAGGVPAPLFINGGTVRLTSTGGMLTLEQGSLIDVSAGAQRRENGSIVPGVGGTLAISSITLSEARPADLTLGAELRGFGLSRGGSLSLAANSICVTAGSCAGAAPDLRLTPEDLVAGGFESVSLDARYGGLEIAPGTTIELRQRNFELVPASADAPGQLSMDGLVREVVLADHLRRPLNLTLRSGFRGTRAVDGNADLTLGAGASIIADTGARVSLTSDSRAFIDGSIIVPGGNVSILLDNTNRRGYRDDQGIWLGDGALVDVSGSTVLRPDGAGFRTGQVVNGGNVAIVARRGFVYTSDRSTVDASGSAGVIDVRQADGSYVATQVASRGGSIEVTAAEALLLNGELRAPSGDPGSVEGGSLSVRLDTTSRVGAAEPWLFPGMDRSLSLAAAPSPTLVAAGAPLPAALAGTGYIGQDVIRRGGFDSLRLAASNVLSADQNSGEPLITGYGRILLESGVDLELGARIFLAASSIGSRGTGAGHASLSAPYLALTRDEFANPSRIVPLLLAAPDARPGAGTLTLNAAHIDVLGSVTLDQLAQTDLRSSSDLRLSGVLRGPNETAYVGRLESAGSLTLVAQQVYPTTLTDFTIAVNGDGNGVIRMLAAQGTAGAALSVGGTLRLQAHEVDVAGRLRAPMGSIIVDADKATVRTGGSLSVSLEGATIPFGTTQGDLAWSYALGNEVTLVYGPQGRRLPEKRITLDVDDLTLEPDSTLDISGGGKVLGYEFQPGPGGTRDVLSATVRPNQYAILPGANPLVAHYDPAESAGFRPGPGTAIWLAAGSGVPEGYYTLLPARYALLPGAYLVTPASGYADLSPGTSFQTSAGGRIVAGAYAVAGTGLRDSRTQGFLVTPGTSALSEARYVISDADSYFSAIDPESRSTLLPRDAGTATLLAATDLDFAGRIRAAAGTGGRGSVLEIAVPRMVVVAGDAPAPDGAVAISADRLASLGAQRILLGGTETETADETVVNVRTDSISIASGAQLSAPELLLVANDLVRVESGASVSATGTQGATLRTTPLSMAGGASLLRVSSAGQVDVRRSGFSGAPGGLELLDGSRVQASGSITLDVEGSVVTQGELAPGSGSLALGASRIGLGGAPADFQGIVVDADVLSGLGAGELVLRARSELALFSNSEIVADRVSVTTPVIRAGAADTAAVINANRLELAGTASAADPVQGGAATLRLNVDDLQLGDGAVSLLGFSQVDVRASRSIEAAGDGGLLSSGSMSLQSPLIVAGAASDYRIVSAGDLAFALADAPAASPRDWTRYLGGSLAFSGRSIGGSSRIVAPGGRVAFLASAGDVALGEGTSIDVSGRVVDFDGVAIGAPGGSVLLQSRTGSVTAAAGAGIDVSAPSGTNASAGTLTVIAPGGEARLEATLRGVSAAAASGGSVRVEAGQVNFDSLRVALGQGGYTGDWIVEQRGPGDLVVDAGQSVQARSLRLVADGGIVRVAGEIDARAPRGGRIVLVGSNGVEVTGVLDARGSDEHVRGGRVELASDQGVLLSAASRVRVGGTSLVDPALAPGGELVVRTSRAALLSATDGNASDSRVRLDGRVEGARRIEIEGVERYEISGDVSLGSNQVAAVGANPWYADAADFVDRTPEVLAGLGLAGRDDVALVPGLQIDVDGDVALGTDWNFYDWRFGAGGEVTGVLTLRAAGDIVLDGSLNDAFATSSDFQLAEDEAGSWSYRLAAGARLGSADPLAVQAFGDSLARGDLIVGAGVPTSAQQRMVRTGSGFIEIAAARDVRLSNGASVIYTAGEPAPGIRVGGSPYFGGLAGLAHPVNAGFVRIAAGRDVVGGNSSQLYTPWLLRSGAPDASGGPPTAWTINFAEFEQGVAAFGGGAVSVIAGRDVRDLSVSVPSIGRRIAGPAGGPGTLLVAGGGDATVEAGRSILGGQFFVDRGLGRIEAGDSVLASDVSGTRPILALGDSTFDVVARRSIALQGALDPMLLYAVDSFGTPYWQTYFSNFSDRSAVSALALGGETSFMGDSQAASIQYPGFPWTLEEARFLTTVTPPTVRMVSMSSDVQTDSAFYLWPAPRGNLQLLARGELRLSSATMSDAELGTQLPTPELPGVDTALIVAVLGAPSVFNAPRPVHGPSATDPDGDLEPARLVALDGDIVAIQELGTVYVPKALRVVAGRDVSALSVQTQHFAASQVSTIQAGRDVLFPSTRDASGRLRADFGNIVVDGPGTMEVIAGRDVDLQTSIGITTRGNLVNPVLPERGADVSITVGLAGRSPAYDAFTERYLVASRAYDKELIAYVARATGAVPVDAEAALAAFKALDRALQRPLLEEILFAEIRAGGRSAAKPGDLNGDFTRAFLALETYLPGSNPEIEQNEANPYSGDIRLFFSRVYTLDGGNVRMLAPGGEINVGLASPPTAFGLRKQPSDLGVVVQSAGSVAALAYADFLVNESRTFAADGGDILVWSTRGDIDAGRGAKTAISAPPPIITIDATGRVVLVYPAALTGSGIQTLATTPGNEPGDVDLFAPRGVVDAGDAGIVAGNLTIAATAVLGANNIQVSGTSVGVPVDAGGLGASLAGVSAVGGAASSAAESAVAPGSAAGNAEQSVGDSALSWLDVFVVGLGEEQCDPKDVECLRRQKKGD